LQIHLITVQFGQAPGYEIVDGMHVHRVPVALSHDFFHWVVNMNQSMGHHGGKLMLEEGAFDLIHAHDWLVGDAAIALKHHFKIPLVATIHATEFGRYDGLHNPTHHYINGKEKQLAHEAWRVIVCTDYMRREVERALASPWEKMDVVYNGIRPEKKWRSQDFDYWRFRQRFAADGEKIVYYVGRMTHEKGVPNLLNAAPKVLWEMGGQVKFVIIGGGNADHLKRQVWDLGISEKCYFTGFMSDDDLDKFQTITDCAVFPSLYEPFGIVALESFAARVPVVVSDTGGLPEVVRHTKTGIITWTNSADSLAWGILEVLKNPGYARWLVDNAYEDLERRFSWPQLARQTETVYNRVVNERFQVVW
ncbi:MAG: glycosyltransferase family 4 protein, partial [Cyanothece sp. SIO1E1]|nr:glycosyltransferase family 4 protein [Cyanothece sp. SIO1E1]